MAQDIQLNDPALRIRHERERKDSLMRRIKVYQHYAALNGFGDRIDAILLKVGGKALATLDYSGNDNSALAIRRQKLLMPKMKQALTIMRKELKDEIKGGTKGNQPIGIPIKYKFIDKDDHLYTFDFDPTTRARDALEEFESALEAHAFGDNIRDQFIPTFNRIRREMTSKWGWDKRDASVQATLLAIKELSDEWMHAR